MRGGGNAPRDWLYAFMRHWLAALLDLERPDLYQCLPEDFNLGHPLPPGQHPLVRRKGFVPNGPLIRLSKSGCFSVHPGSLCMG